MSNSMMIKITNNATASTGALVIPASREAVVSLHRFTVVYHATNGNIVSISTDGAAANTYTVGGSGATGVTRIQLGNLGRNGQFYTVADSQ